MKKYYKIFKKVLNFRDIKHKLYLRQCFNNEFDTREEAINFMLNKDNFHLFSEKEEYLVMEIFKKLPKNIEDGK